ncbi:hypothetical protein BDZ94DRAFT_1155524 [Collybia nuda]|uniref:protein-tyrosine-phosphatase n=1 Tax=Collybia nuda TaxID=64659 RepID=A0A9P5YD81_9AGAR|nr:hypothetical protein BDZ94DRAFT_1155524 [Collybia nuda]
MDEVSSGLWIGDLPSALDVENLKTHRIFSILSAMRGRITINETFIRHQILLDDTEDADILRHLLPSIHFIQAELDKGRGVLVHCHAGISRSATIVAAYLMYSRNMDTESALEEIRNVRPNVEPNEGFLRQLEIFHQAQFKISRRDKTTRMYYMERALEEVMNGDGSLPETDMFAKFPYTPSDSAPTTPGGPRRRIRCKMCRHELATREHMLDHGQLGPATPASRTPASSRRPSTLIPHRPSMNQPRPAVAPMTDSRPRRPSLLSFSDTLTMSTMENEGQILNEAEVETEKPKTSSSGSTPARRISGGAERPVLRNLPQISHGLGDPLLSMSALEDDSDDGEETPSLADTALKTSYIRSRTASMSDEAAKLLGRRLSNALLGPEKKLSAEEVENILSAPLSSPSDLAAQLYANPKLAGLRSPIGVSPLQAGSKAGSPISPPILANPKCSGYFVEPMKWMEHFLESGQLAGKIICPNPKCGAKLGNYDWAGVCCGCKEWVTPGFCINRSKVDEVV